MKNQALGHLQWDLSFTSAPAQHFYRRIKIPLFHEKAIIFSFFSFWKNVIIKPQPLQGNTRIDGCPKPSCEWEHGS